MAWHIVYPKPALVADWTALPAKLLLSQHWMCDPCAFFLNPFPVATMLHCHQNLEPEPQIIAVDPDLYVQIVRRYSVKALPIGLLANNGHVSPVGTL
jgi:hypothetical protein